MHRRGVSARNMFDRKRKKQDSMIGLCASRARQARPHELKLVPKCHITNIEIGAGGMGEL